MWDLPGPELEPVSPALAGGFLTTAPPGMPFFTFLMVPFEAQVFNFDKVQFIYFPLVVCTFGVISKKGLVNPRS